MGICFEAKTRERREREREKQETTKIVSNICCSVCGVCIFLIDLQHEVRVKNTPQEVWSRRNPNISHLKVFESVARVHILDKKRAKLDDKSEKFIFII